VSRKITDLGQVSEFPLCWPEVKPRTAARVRSPFKVTLAKAQREVEREMSLWGARGYVVSMAPAYRSGLVDPATAVWWNMPARTKGGPFELRVLACDRYPDRPDNLHAVALTLTGLRAFTRYGTYTLEQAAEGARPALPPPASDEPVPTPWWEVLGAAPTWPLEAVEMAYRTKAEKAHPDRGGSAEVMAELNAAIGRARQELRA